MPTKRETFHPSTEIPSIGDLSPKPELKTCACLQQIGACLSTMSAPASLEAPLEAALFPVANEQEWGPVEGVAVSGEIAWPSALSGSPIICGRRAAVWTAFYDKLTVQ
jgi:hypothetical protein